MAVGSGWVGGPGNWPCARAPFGLPTAPESLGTPISRLGSGPDEPSRDGKFLVAVGPAVSLGRLATAFVGFDCEFERVEESFG